MFYLSAVCNKGIRHGIQCKENECPQNVDAVHKNASCIQLTICYLICSMYSLLLIMRFPLISFSGKSFYGIMRWRFRLNTSEASNRYYCLMQATLDKFQYTNEFNKSSNSYYIPVCYLLLYTHCSHKWWNSAFCPPMIKQSGQSRGWTKYGTDCPDNQQYRWDISSQCRQRKLLIKCTFIGLHGLSDWLNLKICSVQ